MRSLLTGLALAGLAACRDPAGPGADSADPDPVADAVARDGAARVLVRLPDDPADDALRWARGGDRVARLAARSARIREGAAALAADLPAGARALATFDHVPVVRAWLRDPWGNTSTALVDTLGLDATAPAGGSVTAVPTAGGADLSWTGFTDARSGIVAYRISALAGAAPASCATFLSEATGATGAISGCAAGVAVGVRVCAVDAAGNVSAGATRSVTPL